MDEEGQGLSEFIIIVILVAIIVLVSVRLFGRSVRCQFSDTAQQVDNGSSGLGDCEGGTPASPPPEEPEPDPEPPLPPLPPVPPAPPPPPPPSPTPEPSPTPVPTPEEQTFLDPQLGGAPIDICFNFGTICGKPSADNFCALQGFSFAKSFGIGPKIPKTYIAGDGKFCEFPPPQPPACQSFNSIVCVR